MKKVQKKINSKELAIGAWVLSDGELALITTLEKKGNKLYVEAKIFDGHNNMCTDEISISPKALQPIPVTEELLVKNGWTLDRSCSNVYIHPQLGIKNKIVLKQNVPVFHEFRVPYVHQLQNVLNMFNENIGIDLQLFKI